MTLQDKIKELSDQYKIIAEVSLDECHDMIDYQLREWFRRVLTEVHKEVYELNERIVFTLTRGDAYADVDVAAGQILTQLQKRLIDDGGVYSKEEKEWRDKAYEELFNFVSRLFSSVYNSRKRNGIFAFWCISNKQRRNFKTQSGRFNCG